MNPRNATPQLVVRTLDEALIDIGSNCAPLPSEQRPLTESFGRILRETILAPEDMPPFSRSAVDGYAVRQDDKSQEFRLVDRLRAGEWRPRVLRLGETVGVATGAALPGDNLEVVMREDARVEGGIVHVLRRQTEANVRLQGENCQAGHPLLHDGTRLDAGALALLASIGCVEPRVSPRLRVSHWTTGNEIVPPDQRPRLGQIRDCNSILLGSLLRPWACDIERGHLPEDFEDARRSLDGSGLLGADVLLISGGASVGDHDFTRALFEWIGYKIVFSQVKIRPGKPTVFGVNGRRVAFGLPGNPLAHYAGFHLFVRTAMAKLMGDAKTLAFLRGKLASPIQGNSSSREILWPARIECLDEMPLLSPLVWKNSGDIACLAEANALIRVPAQSHALNSGAQVEFLPAIPWCF